MTLLEYLKDLHWAIVGKPFARLTKRQIQQAMMAGA